MTLSEELLWRESLKDKTFDNWDWLNTPRTFYLGSDCSSDSLTVGNLAIYMLARRLVANGWKAVLLVGGATSLIGDPGGKDSERELKSQEEIAKNVEGIKLQVQNLVNSSEITLVNNYDWFKDIGYLEFLREVGKHFSMSELIARDYIQARLGAEGNGISYAEFSYSLIQGYDYYYLAKAHNVELQIGGSDQWGNMLSGVPLIRKKLTKEVHACSIPLVINKSTGKKFGKSEDGAVWLDSQKTSVFKFYQFWINIDDADLEYYLKIYTDYNQTEIETLIKSHSQNPSQRLGQKNLAAAVTNIVHGQVATDKAINISEALFGKKDYQELTSEELDLMANELPLLIVSQPTNLVDLMLNSGLVSSTSEARRAIAEKSIYLNGQKLSDDLSLITQDSYFNDYLIIRRGKNNTVIIKYKA